MLCLFRQDNGWVLEYSNMNQNIQVQFHYDRHPVHLCSCELDGTYDIRDYEEVMRMCQEREHLFLQVVRGDYISDVPENKPKYGQHPQETCHIEVETEAGIKLGVLPWRYTEILANLLNAGKHIYAEVLETDPTLAWMRVDIYMLDEGIEVK